MDDNPKVVKGSVFDDSENHSLESWRAHWKRRLIRRIYPLLLLCIDTVILFALFTVFSLFRYGIMPFDALHAVSFRVLVAISLPSILAVWLIGGYNYSTQHGGVRFKAEHIIASSLATLVGIVLIYSFIAYGVKMNASRAVVAFTFVGFPTVSIIYREVLSRLKSKFEADNYIAIIGVNDKSRDLYRRLSQVEDTSKILITSFDANLVEKSLVEGDSSAPIIISADRLDFELSWDGKFVKKYILAMDSTLLPMKLQKKVTALAFESSHIQNYSEFLSEKFRIEPANFIDANWPLREGFLLNRHKLYNRLKRSLDISMASVGLVLAFPIMLITALIVKLTSKGPILFKQSRVGYREKPFLMIKFRSMVVDSENGAKYTEVNDARFTSVGKFIRATRLDELPQLWNVLVGDMSLIGPRAEWVDLVNGYEERIPYYHYRHAVKPGITGWAQVNYSYGVNDNDTLEKLNYDLYYVRRYSFILDVTILIKTVYMMLFGKGT